MAAKSATGTKDTVEAGLEKLKTATSQLTADIYGHRESVAQAEQSIEQAKAARDGALDSGDTGGFEKAMSDLRQANTELTRLQQAGNWQSRLGELDSLHKGIVALARKERTSAEAAMRQARTAFEAADALARRAVDALGIVNELRRLLDSQHVSG